MLQRIWITGNRTSTGLGTARHIYGLVQTFDDIRPAGFRALQSLSSQRCFIAVEFTTLLNLYSKYIKKNDISGIICDTTGTSLDHHYERLSYKFTSLIFSRQVQLVFGCLAVRLFGANFSRLIQGGFDRGKLACEVVNPEGAVWHYASCEVEKQIMSDEVLPLLPRSSMV